MYDLIYVSFNLVEVKVENELDSLWDVDKMIINLDTIQKNSFIHKFQQF